MSLKSTNGAYIAAYTDGFHDGAKCKEAHNIVLMGYEIGKLIEIIGEYEINNLGVKMTRDEAIEIEKRKLDMFCYEPEFTANLAAANIDALIELGLLKVDVYVPPSPVETLANKICWSIEGLQSKLDEAGLKIVEK